MFWQIELMLFVSRSSYQYLFSLKIHKHIDLLKLDIEGAEFDVLDKMIEDGSIKYINELCGELHAEKIQRSTSIEDELRSKLKIYGKEFIYMGANLKSWPK